MSMLETLKLTDDGLDAHIRSLFPARILKRLNDLTIQRSNCESLSELIRNCGSYYRPTIRCVYLSRKTTDIVQTTENVFLADAFDDVMASLGEDLRAYRG